MNSPIPSNDDDFEPTTDNFDDDGGRATTVVAYRAAMKFRDAAIRDGLPRPQLMPTPDGEISMHFGSHFVVASNYGTILSGWSDTLPGYTEETWNDVLAQLKSRCT